MSIKDLVPKFGRKGDRMPMRRKDEDSMLYFQREMNRLFDDFFHGFGLETAFDWGEKGLTKAAFSPRVDVSETKKEVKVSAELPGMDEKDITVELGDDIVTIRGEKKEEHEDKGKNWYRKEQSHGAFHRAIPLPASVDGENAKAKFRKGKLTVTIPKTEEGRSNKKSIHIETD
jgi:HSP20 family protein